jgi:acyl dehydratase
MQTTQERMTFAVGDELPTFQRESGFAHWNRYAAVNDEFVPIHMDDAAGQASGYPTAFGMGNLTWAYMHAAIRGWMGESARIVRISTQFRAAITRNNRVSIRGVVTAVRKEGPETIVELDVWAEDATGARLAPGAATVALSG